MNFTCCFLPFKNVATRKFKITYVTNYIYMRHIAVELKWVIPVNFQKVGTDSMVKIFNILSMPYAFQYVLLLYDLT